MANDRAGVISLTINGASFDIRAFPSIRPSKRAREAIIGVDKYHGTKLIAVAPGMTLTITDSMNVKVKDLQDTANATVYVQLANGKKYKLTGATVTDQLELDPSEGQVELVFAARDCVEI